MEVEVEVGVEVEVQRSAEDPGTPHCVVPLDQQAYQAGCSSVW